MSEFGPSPLDVIVRDFDDDSGERWIDPRFADLDARNSAAVPADSGDDLRAGRRLARPRLRALGPLVVALVVVAALTTRGERPADPSRPGAVIAPTAQPPVRFDHLPPLERRPRLRAVRRAPGSRRTAAMSRADSSAAAEPRGAHRVAAVAPSPRASHRRRREPTPVPVAPAAEPSRRRPAPSRFTSEFTP